MEGHTVVDNHETTDELFSAAIKQCFDDSNESLEEKVNSFYFKKKFVNRLNIGDYNIIGFSNLVRLNHIDKSKTKFSCYCLK